MSCLVIHENRRWIWKKKKRTDDRERVDHFIERTNIYMYIISDESSPLYNLTLALDVAFYEFLHLVSYSSSFSLQIYTWFPYWLYQTDSIYSFRRGFICFSTHDCCHIHKHFLSLEIVKFCFNCIFITLKNEVTVRSIFMLNIDMTKKVKFIHQKLKVRYNSELEFIILFNEIDFINSVCHMSSWRERKQSSIKLRLLWCASIKIIRRQ